MDFRDIIRTILLIMGGYSVGFSLSLHDIYAVVFAIIGLALVVVASYFKESEQVKKNG